MKTSPQIVNVSLGPNSYKIHIGSGILPQVGKEIASLFTSQRATIISNSTISSLYAGIVFESLKEVGFRCHTLEVPEGEKYKSLETAADLYDRLIALNARRFDPIIALGGGVIGDLVGYVAATYMRGVPYVQIPTSLLAQVDSSVGGKVAVNHSRGKNLIGCFYQPRLVFIDLDTLQTLPARELRAGLAEVVKYSFLRNSGFLSYLEKNVDSILELNKPVLLEIVKRCCQIKARIVEEDEKDLGTRAILNYGHTIGHAIEALSGYEKYRHGEAISIGMVAAAWIAHRLGFLKRDDAERHEKILNRLGLPTAIKNMSDSSILDQMRWDKKWVSQKSRFVLLEKIGSPILCNDVPQSTIRKVLDNLGAT